MNLLRATATIGGLTLLSRIAGFVRDVLMARFVGAGMAADAFLIAFRLPNLFRALFAEGAFSAAFVPMFARRLGKAEAGEEAREALGLARSFAEDVLSVLLPVLLVFNFVMILAAAPVVWALTGGFPDAGAEKLGLTIDFTRLAFPYLLLISLVSLMGGILNSIGRFWANAAAPLLLNITLIIGLLTFQGDGDIATARGQALFVSLAGIAQFLWLLWSCLRADIRLRLRRPRLTADVRRLLALIGPAALGAGAVQINLLISTALAARFLDEGAVSHLYYADRLNQLPLGLIGIGVGTALLPTMSRLLGADDAPAAIHNQNRAIELVLFLTLPAAAALGIAALPIIRGLFEQGRFLSADSIATARALSAFALGLPAYVLIKVLTPGYHARQDTRMPVKLAVMSMLVNLVANLILIWPFGHVGIALGTALAAWVNAFALWWVLRRRGHLTLDPRLCRALPRLLIACAAMALVLVLLVPLVLPHMSGGLPARSLALALLIASGGVVYLAAARLTGLFTLAELKTQFSRRGKR
ncbi:murein biosynthesis integral membrane protein MurJ [Polymorphobacter sp.]|uniref:murein biosynthesis integral membrane protein MurJ n=1 Tax=Polymorphobacter sp. TaxID=1909290 RepID=UPI003F708D24